MSKTLYIYDPTKHDYHTDIVADDYVLQANETFTQPVGGLYEPITWDGAKWVGTDEAVWQAAQDAAYQEHLKENPEAAPQPTAEQQQISELIKSNAQQMAVNAQLVKQVSALQLAQATQTAQASQALQAAQTQTTQEAK